VVRIRIRAKPTQQLHAVGAAPARYWGPCRSGRIALTPASPLSPEVTARKHTGGSHLLVEARVQVVDVIAEGLVDERYQTDPQRHCSGGFADLDYPTVDGDRDSLPRVGAGNDVADSASEFSVVARRNSDCRLPEAGERERNVAWVSTRVELCTAADGCDATPMEPNFFQRIRGN
jgi:hypothetical protein